jgi:UDP-N-acetylmuramyl tripeptide synthase
VAASAGKPLAWFARDAANPLLARHRSAGGAGCAVADGRLRLSWQGTDHDLGAIAAMPLAAGGQSTFTVSNLAAAALAAAGLGIAPASIAAVFARFGADPADNPGRLMRYEQGGLHLIVDFAHNPAALAGLVDIARKPGGQRRLAILLGQAGNRVDADIHRLATVAAAASPDLVVVKELAGYLRGRGAGEIPAILRQALLRAGVAERAIVDAPDEVAAVRQALAWARPGDVLILALHTQDGRAAALALLEHLRRESWIAGRPLPA